MLHAFGRLSCGLAAVALVIPALALAPAPALAAAAAWCRPGAPLNILWHGTWYPGSAKAPTADGRCQISYTGFASSWDEAVGPDRAGPPGVSRSFAEGAAPSPGVQSAPARASGAAIKAGPYACTSFIGPVTGGGHMVHMPGFSIGAGGKTYTHEGGTRGTVTREADGTVLFHGGALDGQAALYESSSGGHAVLREYNERRSRTVIDCQGPAN